MNHYYQIDFVLFFLKDHSSLGVYLGKENIWNHIEANKEINISRLVFEEIIQRLIDDAYIKENLNSEAQSTYHLTFNGRIFEGYYNNYNSLKKEQERIKNLENKTVQNSKYLNILSTIIAIGTIISAIYYLKEIFK